MKMRWCVVLIAGVCAASLRAQVRFDQGEFRGQSLPVSYEAVALFNNDSTGLELELHYRIGQNFFIFIRDESPSAKAEYVARGELAVELLNDQKVSVGRLIRQLPLSRNTLPKESDHLPSLQGVITFPVRPGTYTIDFSLDDRESGRTFADKSKKITLLDPKSEPFQVSQMMFVQRPAIKEDQQLFVPMNRGGDVLFAESGGAVVEVLQRSTSDSLSIHWTIRGQAEGFGERIMHLEGAGFTKLSGILKQLPQDLGILYALQPSATPTRTIYVPLPLEKLEPGRYTLELNYRSGSATKQVQHEFHIVWPAHPFSLMDPDLAIDALRHIATEADIEAMQSGSQAHRADAFYQFWKQRSRDTTTAYNDAMAEYYYRVDDAMRKFSTSRENDGYKTDRGRIYILYGPPPKSERLLQPDSSPTEIWMYESLHRRFIFIDPNRNGNYILSQAENL